MICFTFWFGEVRSIVVAYNISMTIISGQYIPMRLFPDEIIRFLEWTPIIYLVDFPVSIATNTLEPSEWLQNFIIAIFWCFITWFIGKFIYKKGIRSYEAYGS
tara:strand:+ start:36 stop:344 length:309 start_codon:yes stop_codon:yes gene_type:complete